MTNSELRQRDIDRVVAEFDLAEMEEFRAGPLREKLKTHLEGLVKVVNDGYAHGKIDAFLKRDEMVTSLCMTLDKPLRIEFMRNYHELLNKEFQSKSEEIPKAWWLKVFPSLNAELQGILKSIQNARLTPLRDTGIKATLARKRGGDGRHGSTNALEEIRKRALKLYQTAKREKPDRTEEACFKLVRRGLKSAGVERSISSIKKYILAEKKSWTIS